MDDLFLALHKDFCRADPCGGSHSAMTCKHYHTTGERHAKSRSFQSAR